MDRHTRLTCGLTLMTEETVTARATETEKEKETETATETEIEIVRASRLPRPIRQNAGG